MRKWALRIIVAGLLAALGLWGWCVFFPSPEVVIRKRMVALAKAASFSPQQGLLAKAWNASNLGEFFTPDVQIELDVPGAQYTFGGRDELLQAAIGWRSQARSLKVEFPDIKVVVAPDGNSAVVNLTAKAKVSGEGDLYLVELKLGMIRIKRDWLIKQMETVKTLSWNRSEPPPGLGRRQSSGAFPGCCARCCRAPVTGPEIAELPSGDRRCHRPA